MIPSRGPWSAPPPRPPGGPAPDGYRGAAAPGDTALAPAERDRAANRRVEILIVNP